MSKTKMTDLLTIDYDNLEEKIEQYEMKWGEKPYALIVDNFTVWDLIAALKVEDPEALEKGPKAFESTKLRGLQVLVKIGERRAQLVDKDTFELEKTNE